MTDLDKLAALDDQITGTDQEDLDAIELLIEQRGLLLEEPLEPPELEEPPPAEPQVEPPKADPPTPTMTMDEIKKEFTVTELKAEAAAIPIPGRSRMKEQALIEALLSAGWDPIAALNKPRS